MEQAKQEQVITSERDALMYSDLPAYCGMFCLYVRVQFDVINFLLAVSFPSFPPGMVLIPNSYPVESLGSRLAHLYVAHWLCCPRLYTGIHNSFPVESLGSRLAHLYFSYDSNGRNR